jgi:hypothetical protein
LLYADIEQAPTDEKGRPFVKKAEFEGRVKENLFFHWENVVKKKKESGLQESGRQANNDYKAELLRGIGFAHLRTCGK